MKKINITDVCLLVFSAALCLGVKLVFHACGMKEDGSWMNCHWAEQAVFAISIGLTVTAGLRLLLSRQAKAGAALAMSVVSVMTALLPGVFVRLCMMDTMRCHAVMRPAVIILCALIAVTGIADAVTGRKEA
ncbi:MAG: DUF4418 family protein [Oscillospiraceae bacterium]|nr:DUF4418 family protein [Oscillospiraceae bacterium]